MGTGFQEKFLAIKETKNHGSYSNLFLYALSYSRWKQGFASHNKNVTPGKYI
jgi:hypothetical protein